MYRFVAMWVLMGVAAVAGATDSTVEWSFGVPQTMALGLGSGDAQGPGLASCTQVAAQRSSAFQDRIVVTNTGWRRGELTVRTQPLGGNGSSTCTAAVNTTLALYRGSFTAATPTANCAAFNDDVDATSFCSRLSAISVAPGESITLVVSSANNGEKFPYDLRFDGSIYSPSLFNSRFEPIERFNGRGMPVTGQFTVDTYPAPFAVGSMLNGGPDASGVILGRLALAPVLLTGISTNLGPMTLRAQMWQDGTGDGTFVNGAASYAATNLFFRLQQVTVNGAPVDIGGNCQFGPISWSLAGNGDAASIDLMQPSFLIPPQSAATNCNNFGAQLTSIVSGSDNSVTLSLER